MTTLPRLFLSPPHLSGDEYDLVRDVFESGWVAPLGPHVDAFEREFAERVGAAHAVALSSGTAALHLALQLAGVTAGDEVIVSSLTFAASAFPIRYLGATPVFIDSEETSWNMDMDLLEEALETRAQRGRLPRAVVLVHLYGQSADLDRAVSVCAKYGVPLIEDAAEALGSSYRGRHPGCDGFAGIFSFNGNKIVTTSSGGMLVTGDPELAAHVRKLATQAREPAVHYEHTEIGYNYRLSNVLAAIGRSQLRTLPARVDTRRRHFAQYSAALGHLPGVRFQPEADWGLHTRWLTCLVIDPAVCPVDREAIRLALDAVNIESRPLWKPMHQQPVFSGAPTVGGAVADHLFAHGLCLPSGSGATADDIARVTDTIHRVITAG